MAYGCARGGSLPRDVLGLCCRRPREEVLLRDGALLLQWRSANLNPNSSPNPNPNPNPNPDHNPSPGPNQVRFYCSGDVLALLLEKDGAIGAWRTLLGPGDPAVARGYTDRFGRVHRAKAPRSVRALYGTNKQANAAHGADSPEAARREISLIFGAELVEPQELPEQKAAV